MVPCGNRRWIWDLPNISVKFLTVVIAAILVTSLHFYVVTARITQRREGGINIQVNWVMTPYSLVGCCP
jgi:hypothetical protein